MPPSIFCPDTTWTGTQILLSEQHCPLWRTEARSSTRDAASRTASFSRNCPGAAEIAGKPPAVCSATPGVVMKKVSVIR